MRGYQITPPSSLTKLAKWHCWVGSLFLPEIHASLCINSPTFPSFFFWLLSCVLFLPNGFSLRAQSTIKCIIIIIIIFLIIIFFSFTLVFLILFFLFSFFVFSFLFFYPLFFFSFLFFCLFFLGGPE